MIKTRLVDRRNAELIPSIVGLVSAPGCLVGLDCETFDQPHPGILAYRGKKSAKVFDIHRTVVTGFSIYVDGSDTAYYFNLYHADVENRLTWEECKPIIDALPAGSNFVCHNANYERTVFQLSLGYSLKDILCTLIMAVTAFGPDEYDVDRFNAAGLGEIAQLIGPITKAFAQYVPKQELDAEQSELLYKVISKSSKAGHSYNGFVKDISYGYGLKKLVKSIFNYKMTNFEDLCPEGTHMGMLTGDQVAEYGAEDAYWAVRVFHWLLAYMAAKNPGGIQTYLTQENPMLEVYSDIWQGGMKVNLQAVADRKGVERAACARIMRAMKPLVASLLPFPAEPNDRLMELDGKLWYKNFARYRGLIETWAKSKDADDFGICMQIQGPVSAGWCEDTGKKKSKVGPNFTHYMPMRTVLYDLFRERPMVEGEKTQSDGESRGKLMQRLEKRIAAAASCPGETCPRRGRCTALDDYKCQVQKETENRLKTCIEVIKCLNELAGVEQRMKLYLTPYVKLTDPDTVRMYPVCSSMLASRRMATQFPNPMQLAKQGESTYIRGFYLPDNDDHVIVSLDLRQIELVLIGEASGDPEFAKAYGQLPYDDLHLGAAADILSAIYDVPLTAEQFKSLKDMPDDVVEPFGFPLVDNTGKVLTPKQAYSFNRGTAGGKGANFGYWYSGTLNSVAQSRGVSSDLMWKMTERYRTRFATGEAWRLALIQEGVDNGYITLPDGHTRVRFESTPQWAAMMRAKWRVYENYGCNAFADLMINKIQRRSNNQLVNSAIQGTCATIIKRSIRKGKEEVKACGMDARFLIPIHDEKVWSVRRSEVKDFIPLMKGIMTNHPDIISKLKMDSTVAIGNTFQPFHATQAPMGQIELDELPKLPFLDKGRIGQAANDNEIEETLKYLRAA